MKKYMLVILLSLMLVGCVSTKVNNEVNILVPSGIPFIAIGDLIDENNISIESVSGPDLLVSGMISKSHDIIIAPINVGAKVYIASSSNYHLDSIITFGNSYLVSRKATKLNTVEDLNDKSILAYGKNATPDIVLRKVIDLKGVNTEINYLTGIDQIVPMFICNPLDSLDTSCSPPNYILSSEPIISKLEVQYNMELNILDLQAELGSSLIPQAGIFVNPDSENQESIAAVLKLIEKNIEYLNNNPKEYSKSIVEKHQYFENLKSEIIEKSIPRSNIDYLKAIKNKDICNDYFKMLNEYNPNLLGGKVPNDNFYRS